MPSHRDMIGSPIELELVQSIARSEPRQPPPLAAAVATTTDQFWGPDALSILGERGADRVRAAVTEAPYEDIVSDAPAMWPEAAFQTEFMAQHPRAKKAPPMPMPATKKTRKAQAAERAPKLPKLSEANRPPLEALVNQLASRRGPSTLLLGEPIASTPGRGPGGELVDIPLFSNELVLEQLRQLAEGIRR